jgi:hypothetical protein
MMSYETLNADKQTALDEARKIFCEKLLRPQVVI